MGVLGDCWIYDHIRQRLDKDDVGGERLTPLLHQDVSSNHSTVNAGEFLGEGANLSPGDSRC